MNKRSIEKEKFWSTHMAQFAKSGLTKASYCTTRQLKSGQFDYWRQRLKAQPKAKTSDFVRVTFPTVSDESYFRLTFPGDMSIECDGSVSTARLREVIALLRN